MYKKEKFMVAEYKGISLKQQDAVKLRGFFADMDEKDSLLHNHLESGENIYRYPKVQYKVVNGHPTVVAFGEGINSLYPRLMAVDSVVIGGKEYPDPDLQIRLETKVIGDSRSRHGYKFLTPWLALNQENYKKYMALEPGQDRQEMLEKILTGNILSLCRGFEVQLEQQVQVTAEVKEVPVHFKGESMIGFVGSFEANVRLPGLCGIGKGVSRGMGTLISFPLEQEEKEKL